MRIAEILLIAINGNYNIDIFTLNIYLSGSHHDRDVNNETYNCHVRRLTQDLIKCLCSYIKYHAPLGLTDKSCIIKWFNHCANCPKYTNFYLQKKFTSLFRINIKNLEKNGLNPLNLLSEYL